MIQVVIAKGMSIFRSKSRQALFNLGVQIQPASLERHPRLFTEPSPMRSLARYAFADAHFGCSA
ncbi:hypothetical protein CCR96_22885 [Halochromatium roseum]|nr:hypothetical protein [Halochromatium roseum]